MKRFTFLLIIAACFITRTLAQEYPILLFPDGAPGEMQPMVEKADSEGGRTGGRQVLRISNVSEPTITIFSPSEEIASGAAILVCPGGGYSILAYDLEGIEICEWLNELGITAFLLKYRVPHREGRQKHEAALQDAQRAMSYIRAHANEYNIDENSIGVMGFSAGAHLSAMLSNSYQERTYPEIDAFDKVSSRPDFTILVYPAYLDASHFQVAPEIKVTSLTPPTMIIQTKDDKSYINSSLFYYYALKEADVPVWMHLYDNGGHGYGLRDTGSSVNLWPARVEDWFYELGILNEEE